MRPLQTDFHISEECPWLLPKEVPFFKARFKAWSRLREAFIHTPDIDVAKVLVCPLLENSLIPRPFRVMRLNSTQPQTRMRTRLLDYCGLNIA